MTLPNRIVRDEVVRGEAAYVYGFKRRAQEHHCLGYGTFSIDVATLAALRKTYARQVQPVTYRAIYVKALALALKQHPEANAILFKKWFGLFGRRRIVRFDSIDVNLPVTRDVDGKTVTFIATVRDPANKTLAQIQDELAHLDRCAPEESFYIQRIKKFARMPLWLARFVHWLMTVSPSFYVKNVGTCGLTFIEGDWYDNFFPIGPTSVVFCMGAVRHEPVAEGTTVVAKRRLRCTAMVDNYVISGLVGAQVAKTFKDLLESGAVVRAELA